MHLFDMRPMNFLIKPLQNDKIEKAVEKGLALCGRKAVSFRYKQGREYHQAYIRDIIYFRSRDRELEIVTRNGQDRFYGALEQIYIELKDYRFFYAHKSYLVNYASVTRFNYESLLMSDGTEIKIGQSRRKSVRELHHQYAAEEMEV